MAFAGDAIVATSELLSLRLAVPGAVVPMAGVTAVAVHAVHRAPRPARPHDARAPRGDPRARARRRSPALWASEAGIYGRWGFGAATRAAHLTIRSPEARLAVAPCRAARRAPAVRMTLLDDLRAVHAAVAARAAGHRSRATTACGSFALADFEEDRDGAGRLRALVQDGRGRPEGYALFAVRKQRTADDRPDDVVELRELVATTTAGGVRAVGPPARAVARAARCAGRSRARGRAAAAHARRPARGDRPARRRALPARVDLPRRARPARPTPRRSTSCSRSRTPSARGTRAAGGSPATRRARRCEPGPPTRRTWRSARASSAPRTSAARRSRRSPRRAASRSGPRARSPRRASRFAGVRAPWCFEDF